MADLKIKFRELKQVCERSGDKLTYVFCALVLVATLCFLYGYFFRALIDFKVLKTLKNEVAPEVIDIKLWQELNDNSKDKKEPLKTELIKGNPFR